MGEAELGLWLYGQACQPKTCVQGEKCYPRALFLRNTRQVHYASMHRVLFALLAVIKPTWHTPNVFLLA